MPSIVVTGRDERVTSRHKQHAEDKIAKLERYFDGIVKIEVVLGHEKEGAEAEILLSVRGGKPLVSQSRQEELYAAIDTVLDKAEVQLVRHKEKLKGHRAAPAGRHPEEILVAMDGSGDGDQPTDPEEQSYQEIVEQREYSSDGSGGAGGGFTEGGSPGSRS